jgi:hypothetical protein
MQKLLTILDPIFTSTIPHPQYRPQKELAVRNNLPIIFSHHFTPNGLGLLAH